MKNLAGNTACDIDIAIELTEAGINCRKVNQENTEVPYSVIGQLGDIVFRRSWYYWRVTCKVPLVVAEEIYSDPIGKRDVRVAGDAGGPHPLEWAFPDIETFKKYDLEGKTCGEIRELCNSGEINAPRFVTSYHIDSQEGLNLFTEVMRKYGLNTKMIEK